MMKDSEPSMRDSVIKRREFLKRSAGTAATVVGLNAAKAFGQSVAWWNARPSKQGVGQPVSIDLHAHWSPEAYIKAVAELGHPINPYPLYYDLDKRVKWMDEHGVKMHVLSLDGKMPWQWATPEQGARLAQIINDAGVEAHTAYPERFVTAAEMPVKDPALALKELNRVAGKPGVRAVHLPDSYGRHDYLFEPAFEPIFARCEELGYPLVLHQIGGVPNTYGGERLIGPPNLSAALDAPMEHAIQATKFITRGTLDKYPKLEIVLPHAGGDFPYVAGRVEHFLYHMEDPHYHIPYKLAHPFKEYLRRFHYDYLTYYPEAFRFLINLVGSDRIVVGTDCYAAKDIEYPNAVVDQFNLSAADRERILRGNAIRLLHL
jgi:aminocarboxymuconate-semialdehyde decarboxylase